MKLSYNLELPFNDAAAILDQPTMDILAGINRTFSDNSLCLFYTRGHLEELERLEATGLEGAEYDQ